MFFPKYSLPDTYLEIDSYKIEYIKSFTYLGSIITPDNRMFSEIQNRLYLANKDFYGLRRF